MKQIRIMLLALAWVVLGVVSTPRGYGGPAPGQATLSRVEVSRVASSDVLDLRIEGGYSFKAVEAAEDTVFIDLTGVKAGSVSKTGHWSGGLLTGYHLLAYIDAAHQPVVRVQVEMKDHEPFKVQKDRTGLRLVFGQSPAVAASVTPAPVARARSAAGITKPQPAAQQPATAPSGPTVVSKISIDRDAEGATFVDIATNRPTAYRVIHLQNPARLVVDLEDARLSALLRTLTAHSPLLKDVRAGQFRAQGPAVVRIVADLTGNPIFDVHAQPGGVRIELKTHGLDKQSAVPTAALSVPTPAEKPIEVAQAAPPVATPMERAESMRAEPATPAIAPVATAPEPVSANGAGPQPVPPAAPRTDYQAALPAAAGGNEVTAAPRLEPPPQTPENLQAARAAKVLAGEAAALSAAPQGQPAGGAAPAPGNPKYTGEPISLNLKDVDLKDFFRLIHEISGLNMIVDPNVSGSVTLVLDSVPWDQALDIVLKNNRLDKTLEGNVLRIARVETLSAEQQATTQLAAAREEAQPLVTVFQPVNYAKAGTIATMLKSWVGGGALTKRGNILLDDRTNTLIISDIQSQIPIIRSIIAKLDTKAKQVSIEARVVLATTTFTRSLNAILTAGTVNKSGSTINVGQSGTTSSVTPTNTFSPNTGPPSQITVASASAAAFGVFSVSNASKRYILDAALAAAESKAEAKTISRPSIVTQNNVAGSVQQGTQIPIQTTINNTISIQYVAATLQLTVTPQVTEDGNIFMVINVTNATPGEVLTSAGPSITTQTATTQVLVPDGGTVVFGGVTVTSRSKTATYVPLLGNIPIFGHLFKTTSVSDSDKELLFFVSPKVLPG